MSNEVYADNVDVREPVEQIAVVDETVDAAGEDSSHDEIVDVQSKTVPLKAHAKLRQERRELRDELDKRNQEVAEFREKLARLEGRLEQKPETELKDLDSEFFANPSGFTVKQAKTYSDTVRNESITRSINDAHAILEMSKDDAKECIDAFLKSSKDNPALTVQFQQMAQTVGGARAVKFAYDQGKKAKEIGKYESVASMKEALRKEILEELKADVGDGLPRSQAGARNVSSAATQTKTPTLSAVYDKNY